MLSFILVILAGILAIQAAFALPQIQLISQIDPLEFGTEQEVVFNITPGTVNSTTHNLTIAHAIIEFNSESHPMQKTNGNYVYQWVPGQKGTNIYTVHATNSLNETESLSQSFEVQDTIPPQIVDAQPNGELDYNLIEIEATTDENCTCKYDFTDVNYDAMVYGLSGEGILHSKLRSFGDGTTVIYIRCKDESGNIGGGESISFTIDTMPPVISGITPTGTLTQEKIILQFYTDEQASCKWGMENKPYTLLDNSFGTTGNTLHEQPLRLEQGINRYYISCKDTSGNYNDPLVLNLELNLAPTASIDVEKNSTYSALRQGLYRLELEASEALSQAPELRMIYGNSAINVPLEGSSSSWNGYLLIPDGVGEQVGEFRFSGKDLKGMPGNEVTSGKLLLIDTSPPSLMPVLKLANEDKKIKLSWSYEGEEAHHFNIYRSMTGKTDKSDFYATATASSITYFDTNITNKIGYFYMVSAVDNAGNEGPLSEEHFLMADFQNTTSFVQEPTILSAINSKISELERKAQDLEIIVSSLESATDQDLVWLINNEDVVASLKEAKGKIQLLIGELKTYRETRIALEELNSKIEVIDAKVSEYAKGIVTGVSIANKVEREQPYSESLLQQAIEAYAPIKGFSEYQVSSYLQEVKSLQQETRRIQQITSYELEYSDGEKKKVVVVKERIVSPKALQGVVLQEAMPPEAVKISELEFVVEPDDINQLGALWKLSRLEASELAYVINSDKELNLLQEIRTVLLYDADAFLSMMQQFGSSQGQPIDTGQMTGQVAKEASSRLGLNTILLAAGIILALSLLAYYFVFLKSGVEAEQGLEDHLISEEQALISGLKMPGIETALDSRHLVGKDGQNMLVAEQLVNHVQESYVALERGDLASASQSYSLALGQYSLLKLGLKKRMKVNLHLNALRESILKRRGF